MNTRETAAVAGSLPSPCRSIAYVRGGRARVAKPGPRPCRACEAVFTPKKENPEKPAKYCCDKCRSLGWRAERKDRDVRLSSLEARMSALESKLDQILGKGA